MTNKASATGATAAVAAARRPWDSIAVAEAFSGQRAMLDAKCGAPSELVKTCD